VAQMLYGPSPTMRSWPGAEMSVKAAQSAVHVGAVRVRGACGVSTQRRLSWRPLRPPGPAGAAAIRIPQIEVRALANQVGGAPTISISARRFGARHSISAARGRTPSQPTTGFASPMPRASILPAEMPWFTR
jgi:hypothetical protein